MSLRPRRAGSEDYSPAYVNGCLATKAEVSPSCTFGDRTSSKKVVLLGDSHAAQWLSALSASADQNHFQLRVLTKGNCPAPIMSVYNTQLNRTFTECDRWRAWALSQIETMKPALVVVASTFHGITLPDHDSTSPAVEAAWDNGLTALVAHLRAIGAEVDLLSDVPSHAQAVPDCLATNGSDVLACGTPRLQSILTAHEAAQKSTAISAGANYIDTSGWFCTATICPAEIDGIVTEFDDSHLTATYSSYLSRALSVTLGLQAS